MNIRMNCLAIVVALGFLAGTAQGDNPKNYRISISQVSKIGAEELQPGDYQLAVHSHDAKVRFTHVNSGDAFEFEAKIEIVGEKIDNTAIHSDTSSGVNRIREIRLGGSKIRVIFE